MESKMAIQPPSRVNFVFSGPCNMSCSFCFSPFKGFDNKNPTSLASWKLIIDRLKAWNVKNITFSGGDPFASVDFPLLLSYTLGLFRREIFLQIDTNGIGINSNHYSALSEVGLVGLPLDGGNSEVHSRVRKDGHFETIMQLLPDFARHQIPLKINTLVCSKNIKDLTQIGLLLSSFPIKRWSLYEFWPLGPVGLTNQFEFAIPHSLYQSEVEKVQAEFPKLHVEMGSIESRSQAYFFVNDEGLAFTVNKLNCSEYIFLGSIFGDSIIELWAEHGNPSLVQKRFEYRID